MNDQSFEEAVVRTTLRDSRYDIEAYYFLREALTFAGKKFNKPDTGPAHHVTGRELSDGIREFALQEFGPMTSLVMAEWGLATTRDFGNMVYNLINEGVFGKSATDKIEDFDNVFDFADAFVTPYEPNCTLKISGKKRQLTPKKSAPKNRKA